MAYSVLATTLSCRSAMIILIPGVTSDQVPGAMMSQKQCLTRIASQCFVYDRMLLIEALVTPRRPRSGRCESYGFTTTATGLTP